MTAFALRALSEPGVPESVPMKVNPVTVSPCVWMRVSLFRGGCRGPRPAQTYALFNAWPVFSETCLTNGGFNMMFCRKQSHVYRLACQVCTLVHSSTWARVLVLALDSSSVSRRNPVKWINEPQTVLNRWGSITETLCFWNQTLSFSILGSEMAESAALVSTALVSQAWCLTTAGSNEVRES